MKNFTYLIFFITSIVAAQPVLNSTDVNFDGTITAYNASISGFNIGNAGANQTWNYANVVLTTPQLYTLSQVITAPFSAGFPTANYIIKQTSSNPTNFTFFNFSATKLEVIGASVPSGIIVDFSPNPQTFFAFPFVYNQVINDTFSTSTVTTQYSIQIKYDAYGVITTPFGTFNTYRIKRTYDSIPAYYWYIENTTTLLLLVNTSATGISSVQFYQNSNLSNETFGQNKINIFPNPTTGILQSDSFAGNSISIIDNLGRKVKQYANFAENAIDLSDFENGIYFVEIETENQKLTKKVVLQR